MPYMNGEQDRGGDTAAPLSKASSSFRPSSRNDVWGVDPNCAGMTNDGGRGLAAPLYSPVYPMLFQISRARASDSALGGLNPRMLGGGWPGPACSGQGDQLSSS